MKERKLAHKQLNYHTRFFKEGGKRMNDFQELVLEEIRSIEKELQDIRSILEPKKFVPEDSCGKIYSTEKCSNP